jgi:low affinity Fe/Cu permease
MNEFFHKFAQGASRFAGSPWAFLVAVIIIVVWGLTGPFAGYSDTWQLIINTGTTIVTFLMVFLIQNSQNRESKAVQLKLDELMRAVKGARNELIDLEDLTDEELETLQKQFEKMQRASESKKKSSGDESESKE